MLRIISIGTLTAHPLWEEKGQVRTGHATTVLIEAADDVNIIVDPALPPPVLLARMSERTQLKPEQITHVFLTNFQRERRRGLLAFDNARWLMHETEIDAAEHSLEADLDQAREGRDRQLINMIEDELALLQRFKPAPDLLAPNVDLFPLPGVTAGNCGLLLAQPDATVVICGDAIPTIEHLQQGKVLPGCVDLEAAQESFKEAIEIADVLVLGRDNLIPNPVRRIM